MQAGKGLLALLGCCVPLMSVQAATEADYLAFFQRYADLGNAFDTGLAALFSDQARVRLMRRLPDGEENVIELSGRDYRQMINDNMAFARKKGETHQFSGIRVEVLEKGARILASRYSDNNCFTDRGFYLVLAPDQEGQLKIMEEFSESPVRAYCKVTPGQELPLLLQRTAEMLNKELPVMVDDATRLVDTKADGNILNYNYELVDKTVADLDLAALEQHFRPMVLQQSCQIQNLRLVLDQGGSVQYHYHDREHREFMVVDINQDSCLQ
ncbi:MAG: hypothetical protein KDI44_02665 [Thiothrix sp.]|nr:hypothetical protein [Thiothrix sp.]HPQ95737.1 hypothetical protein [Thiolinea sp.]